VSGIFWCEVSWNVSGIFWCEVSWNVSGIFWCETSWKVSGRGVLVRMRSGDKRDLRNLMMSLS
jgi:hypothetical protein